jgi:hypothetical protein
MIMTRTSDAVVRETARPAPTPRAPRRPRPAALGLATLSLSLGLGVVATPGAAHAFKAPLCSTVTCTGGAPNVSIGASGGLNHPEIVPIFWGSYWNTGTNPSRGQMIGSLQAAVNGAYLSVLGQYGAGGTVIGPARMVPTAPTYTATTPAGHCNNGSACNGLTCSDGSLCGYNDVSKVINTMIGNHAVPGPAPHADILYMVFVPPGFTSFDVNVGGVCDGTCGSYNGDGYDLAWVNGDVLGLDHELVEAISNNVGISNCTYTSSPQFRANQVADLCGCYSESQSGGPFPAYWSQADGACVIPEGWLNVYQYNNSPNSWTQVMNGVVRQIYAGGNGLIATDTNDNLLLYSGTPQQWTQIGGPGAMFAIGAGGGSDIVGLTPNAGAVSRYNGSSWQQIGGPASAVYAGSLTVATDYDGNPHVYSPSAGSWTQIGGPSDQFIVGGAGLVALSLDHGGIWINSAGTLSAWTQIGDAASELFVGGSDIASTALAAQKDVSYENGPFNWLHQGAPGNMFAIIGNGKLFGLNPWRTGVFQSNNTGVVSPPWTQVGGPASRLVGHGHSLYATGGIKL